MEINVNQQQLEFRAILEEANQISSANLRDRIVENLFKESIQLTKSGVQYTKTKQNQVTDKLDSILTSPFIGFPVMIALLGLIFYITIAGANVPSSMIADFFVWVEGYLTS
ncbi:MAG TPA: ferrous iron transporter B, partial [Pseudoneobacillus sp.]|nr:ferrous iron transporter B [Pseudoneobacillus sp.]